MFDMDGTLLHSRPAILKSLRLMMADMQLPPRDDDYLNNMVGPPFSLGMPKFLGLTGADMEKAIAVYGRHARIVMQDTSLLAPFPGILEMLRALYDAGAYLGIVTSKSRTPALEHIERFGFAPYISHLQTADDAGNGEKTELLQRTCQELGSENLVMVGDRFYDLNAANTCGVQSVGVLYGYGSREEIFGCKPTYTAEDVAGLRRILMNMLVQP
ncbi:MAG: HAD-IA family hydrolase [Clostridia bacterium]|nr:HAD-IA family hydrolase [Clostridia bacterium]